MEKEKIGLVLSGGGAKGAFELGAWSYLKDCLNITSEITGYSGTSIGALNMALFLSKNTTGQNIAAWKSINQNDLTNLENIGNTIKKYIAKNKKTFIISPEDLFISKKILSEGFSDTHKLRNICNQLDYDFNTLRKLDIYSGTCKVHYYPLKIEEIYDSWSDKSKREITDAALLSAAIPFLYKTEESSDHRSVTVDGGTKSFLDTSATGNTPIEPLYEMGYRKFIVVYLLNENNPKLKRQIIKENQKYPDIEICRIIPDENFKDKFFKGTLHISEESTENRIKEGTAAAQKTCNTSNSTDKKIDNIIKFEKTTNKIQEKEFSHKELYSLPEDTIVINTIKDCKKMMDADFEKILLVGKSMKHFQFLKPFADLSPAKVVLLATAITAIGITTILNPAGAGLSKAILMTRLSPVMKSTGLGFTTIRAIAALGGIHVAKNLFKNYNITTCQDRIILTKKSADR